MSSELIDCIICCETSTRIVRKIISCPYCTKDTCIKCIKKYILTVVFGEIHCMHCKIEWNTDFVKDIFTRSFLNTEYKIHKKQILFEIEKSKVPHTMIYVEVANEIQEYSKYVPDHNLIEQSERLSMERKKLLNVMENMILNSIPISLPMCREYQEKVNSLYNVNKELLVVKNTTSSDYRQYIRSLSLFLKSDTMIKPIFQEPINASKKTTSMTRATHFLFFLLLSSTTLFGQIKISGKVFDQNSKEPIIGASVKTGENAAITDEKGTFSLISKQKGTCELVVSSIGYNSLTKKVIQHL